MDEMITLTLKELTKITLEGFLNGINATLKMLKGTLEKSPVLQLGHSDDTPSIRGGVAVAQMAIEELREQTQLLYARDHCEVIIKDDDKVEGFVGYQFSDDLIIVETDNDIAAQRLKKYHEAQK